MSTSEPVLFEAFSETVLEINRIASSVRMSGSRKPHWMPWRGTSTSMRPGGVLVRTCRCAANVHASIAYHLPDSYVAAWTKIKADDVLEQAITRESGHAFRLSAEEVRGSRKVADFMRRFDISHCLACLIPSPDTKQMSFLSLYRGRTKSQFEEPARILFNR